MRLMVTKIIVIAWLSGMMLKWAPPERRNSYIPEAKEEVAAARKRYELIAEQFLDVSMGDSAPKLFGGKQGRLRTTVLMAGIALHESGFRKDVHLGLGKLSRGDGGRSWCLFQTNIGTGSIPTDDPLISTWKGPDLVGEANTWKCATAGLHMMARSMRACRALPLKDRLSVYTSGKCRENEYKAVNRLSFGVAQFQRNIPVFSDEDVMKLWKKDEKDNNSEEKSSRSESTDPKKEGLAWTSFALLLLESSLTSFPLSNRSNASSRSSLSTHPTVTWSKLLGIE